MAVGAFGVRGQADDPQVLSPAAHGPAEGPSVMACRLFALQGLPLARKLVHLRGGFRCRFHLLPGWSSVSAVDGHKKLAQIADELGKGRLRGTTSICLAALASAGPLLLVFRADLAGFRSGG